MEYFVSMRIQALLAACLGFPRGGASIPIVPRPPVLGGRAGRLLVALWIPALTGCASTRALCPDEGGTQWREVRTAHFVLKTNLSSEGAVQSALELEQFRGALLSLLWPEAQEPPGVLEAIVLRNPSQLEEFAGPHISGYFSSRSDGQLVVMSSRLYLAGDYGLDLSVVAHELTHHLSFFALARQPKWLSEGLATYLETARLVTDRGRVEMGSLPAGRLRAAQQHRVSVQRLWEWGESEVSDEEPPDLYATSWLFVHALMNLYPEAFADFLKRLAAAEEPRRAFAASLPGVTFDQLDQVLTRYVNSGNYSVIQVKTAEPQTPLKERILTSADAHLIRARLWIRSPRALLDGEAKQRALAEVGEALRHLPNHADALVLRQQLVPSIEGAEALTRQLPTDARAWKSLARSVKADPARQASALDQALALGSRDVEVLIGRAQLHLGSGNGEAALALAQQAVVLEPFSVAALVAFGQANAHVGNCDEAKQGLSRAIERLHETVPPAVRAELLEELRGLEGGCRPFAP